MATGFPEAVGIWFQGDPDAIEEYLEFNPIGIVTNTIVLDDLAETHGRMIKLIERYLGVADDLPVVVEVQSPERFLVRRWVEARCLPLRPVA